MVSQNRIRDILEAEFDRVFEEITLGEPPRKEPFSSGKILEDMIRSGVEFFEAIEILYRIRPALCKGISARQVARLINQALREKGYDRFSLISAGLIDFTRLVLPNGKRETINFRRLKAYVMSKLRGLEYTNSTFKAIVDDLHRIIRSLETEEIKLETLDNLFMVTLKKIVGVNPWAENRYKNDYGDVVASFEHLTRHGSNLSFEEQLELISTFVIHAARILLLSHNFLPTTRVKSTVAQLEKLIARLSIQQDNEFDYKPFYEMGKLGELVLRKGKGIKNFDRVQRRLQSAFSLIEEIVHEGLIQWIMVVRDDGTEFFSRFSKTFNPNSPRSLFAPALAGVQTVIHELSHQDIKQIQNVEGTILVEKVKDVSVIAMVRFPTHHVKQKLFVFSERIIDECGDLIQNFKGQIDEIQNTIETLFNALQLSNLMV
ncbi:MAG: hypothetical protein D6732_15210 [Methanobacteriota archaeon]|nr:MAG: hypothetical protein D6732_15210 [Euryarchaeota archaeon]